VLVPATLSAAEERRLVGRLLARLDARGAGGDEELAARAEVLRARFLPEARRPESVRWSPAQQRSRWGSCTPERAAIRLSTRLQGFPAYVRDYVLVHELAHLLVAGHDRAFAALVARYPHAERAKGFLEGVAAAASLPPFGEE
jgi:hypothetical protein